MGLDGEEKGTDKNKNNNNNNNNINNKKTPHRTWCCDVLRPNHNTLYAHTSSLPSFPYFLLSFLRTHIHKLWVRPTYNDRKYILQAKDWVPAGMADLCKGDEATGVEFVALVHINTAEGCFDVGHGGDTIERPDRGRFRHSPGHSVVGRLS